MVEVDVGDQSPSCSPRCTRSAVSRLRSRASSRSRSSSMRFAWRESRSARRHPARSVIRFHAVLEVHADEVDAAGLERPDDAALAREPLLGILAQPNAEAGASLVTHSCSLAKATICSMLASQRLSALSLLPSRSGRSIHSV